MSRRTLTRPMLSRCVVAIIAAGTLVLAGCGGSDSGGDSSPSPTSPAPSEVWSQSDCAQIAAPVEVPSPPEGSVIEGSVAVAGAIDQPPTVGIQADAAPATSLITTDLVTGSGDPVVAGAQITVQYCGVGLETGAVFDSSWSRGEPITFPLAGVIAGWQEGIPGMQPGGRRLLIIPADLAYGQNPPTPAILPGETLVFVVDLLAG